MADYVSRLRRYELYLIIRIGIESADGIKAGSSEWSGGWMTTKDSRFNPKQTFCLTLFWRAEATELAM